MKHNGCNRRTLIASHSALLVLIAGISGLAAAVPTAAQTVADSEAYGESVSLNVVPLLGAGLPVASGPLPQVSGTAAPAYSKTGNVASAGASTVLTGALLQTGIINVHASSQMPAAVMTHADAATNNTGITLGHLLPLLSLHAQVIQSAATIDGTCGSSLVATGSTDIIGATLGGAVSGGVNVLTHPAANTLLLNLLGVRIILNEQIVSGNGTTNRGLTVNAVHISLTNSLLSGLGLLSGDIVISQSQAHVQCSAVEASADLSLSGNASPNPVAPGGTLTYTVTVTNQGPNPATGVSLTDSLPAGTTFVSATPGQGTCYPGNPVACSLGTLIDGESVLVTIVATVTASQGTLVNTATGSSSVADPGSANNTVTTTTQVQAAGPSPRADLSIAGGGSPDPSTPGSILTYTVNVTNQGPDQATGVTLTDSIPAGVTFASVTTGQGYCTPGNPVYCSLGNLANGQVVTIVLKVVVTASQGTLVDTATVSSGVTDPGSGNNSVTISSQVQAAQGPRADMSVGIATSATSIQVGQTVRVTYTVTNHGPDPATSVVLTDATIARVTVNSVSASQGSCVEQDNIVCNLGSLASGAQTSVTVVATSLSAGTMVCEGDVTSSLSDPDTSNNTATALVQVATPQTQPPVDPGACRIDAVPAATLLFPYFEVDLDHFNGATTLISINNASAVTQLAQLTFWTDWGIPSLSFTIALTGFDVQTLNLRDILGTGTLPALAAGAGCSSQAVASGALPTTFMGHLQAWHSGRQSPLQGNCAAPSRTDNLATGYITVDAVNRCSTLNPTEPGYFVAGGQGVASDQNSLWGSFFLVNGDQNQADGDPAVHILALPSTFKNHYSFYGTFVGGSGADDRQPLGTSYGSSYLSGGAFDGGTQLLVWRDAKVASPKALQCGQEPARMTLGGTAYDEDENATAIVPSTQMAPWSTQKMALGGSTFPLASPFGWVHLDLWHSGGSLFGDVAQGWVTTRMSAQNRYSVGLRAIRLDSACDF